MDKKYSYKSPLVYQRADPWVLYHDGWYILPEVFHSMTV